MKQAARKRLSMKRKAAAIAALQDAQGRVTPRLGLAGGAGPAHPLHNEFEWDTRRRRKRNGTGPPPASIREVKFVVEYEDARVVVPFYLSDPRALTRPISRRSGPQRMPSSRPAFCARRSTASLAASIAA